MESIRELLERRARDDGDQLCLFEDGRVTSASSTRGDRIANGLALAGAGRRAAVMLANIRSHLRFLSARQAGITQVPVNIHLPRSGSPWCGALRGARDRVDARSPPELAPILPSLRSVELVVWRGS